MATDVGGGRGSWGWERRGIRVYIEYQTVCPIVGIGSLSLVSECASIWTQREGKQHSLVSEEVEGGPNLDDWKESLALCLFCGWVDVWVELVVYTTVHE